MSFVLGLTGSIGMGKSTTVEMFREAGVPVWDADAAVHRLYAPGAAGARAVADIAPDCMAADGGVDRRRLRSAVAADPALFDRLAAAIHPLVAADRADFLARSAAPIVVLDIPLLFETGQQHLCAAVAVVSTTPELQRSRVLARGLDPDELSAILARQMPDAEKRARADFVIDSTTFDSARADTTRILEQIRARLRGAPAEDA